ncbi:MAG: hypothetical protein NVV60_12615 [Luteimonas sp.]|nr:hypothetical protein [Luteimonas sp.]
MRDALLALSTAITLTLCACSGSDPAQDDTGLSAAVTQAHTEFERQQSQGLDKTAREVTALEYPMYLDFMRATGLEAELGGEAEAAAVVSSLFAANERMVNRLQGDLPKLTPMSMGAGIGYSGAASSIQMGDAQAGIGAQFWEQAQKEGRTSGSHSDGSTSVEWSQSEITVTTEMDASDDNGKAKGKIRTKVKVTTCPDASGKVEAEFESKTELRSTSSAGTGGFITVTGKMARWLDDDANLIDDRMDSEGRVEQTAFDNYESTHVDVTDTLSTSRGQMGTRVNGRSRSASDANVQGAEGLAKMGRYAAMRAIEQARRAWESGQCITLEPTTDPEKRTGQKPDTTYTIETKPRAKTDGAPTGGTVRATLSGESRLDPDNRKVKADARFTYVNPSEKDKTASIDFEARSKRGIGKATLTFDTKEKKSYRIQVAQCPDGRWESMDVCDVSKPFTVTACGGMGSVAHTPTSDRGGTYAFKFQNHQGIADSSGTYTLAGTEDEFTARYTSPQICARVGGKTLCTTPNMGTVTWTKIEDCDE